MKRISIGALTLALIATVLVGASIAGATASPEPPAEVSPEPPAEVSPEPPAEVSPEPPAEALPESPTPEASLGSSTGEASLLTAEGCFANQICVYGSTTYTNRYFKTVGCGGSGTETYPAGFAFQSATNRCGNKSNWLRTFGVVVACMNPGGNRPHPGLFNEVFVPVNYGSFC